MRVPVGWVLVDDDADMADLVEELRTDEGYVVATLRDRSEESVRATVERLRPTACSWTATSRATTVSHGVTPPG